jgi:hypothetical protein
MINLIQIVFSNFLFAIVFILLLAGIVVFAILWLKESRKIEKSKNNSTLYFIMFFASFLLLIIFGIPFLNRTNELVTQLMGKLKIF